MQLFFLVGDLGLDTNQTFGSELMPPPSSVHLTSPRQSMLHMNSLSSPSNHMPMTPGNFSSLDDNPMLHDPSLPNLNAETVSSILDGNGEMDNQFANMGYDASPGGGISERIANDWHDYDYPPSVDNSGEEQMVDESIEQFEERVLNKRAAQLFVTVRAKLIKEDKILLSDMTYRNTKKQVISY
jgi:cohesin complex subunit SCC1